MQTSKKTGPRKQQQQWKIDHSTQKTAQNPQSKSPGITRQIIWNCTLQKMSKTQTFFLAEGAMSVTDNTQFHIKSSHTRNITQQEASHAPKLGSIQTLTPTHTTKLLRQTTHTASSIITSSKPPIDSLRHLSNHDSPHQNHIPTDPPQGTSKTSTPTQWQQSTETPKPPSRGGRS